MTACPIILTNSHIIVGNGSNLGADVAMSGDATIDNTGAVTVTIGLDDLTDVTTDYSTLHNMFFGQGAGASLTSGDYNLAIGQGAAASLSSGRYNLAIGLDALGAVTDGLDNVALGWSSLHASTGTGNVAVGAGCFFYLVDGNNNTAIGESVGNTLTTGSGNILIGIGADVPNATTNDYINIGDTIVSHPL